MVDAYIRLEEAWAQWNDLDPAGMVACSSGTAALHLALEAFQLPQGSEVLLSDFNMIACPRAVTLAGLTPVLVDCDSRLLMDCELACQYWRENMSTVKVIMAVHIYGRQCRMDSFDTISTCSKTVHERPMYVIEDLAEAHGVKPHPTTDAACWSFFRNKIVTSGEEGGAVWFRDPAHAALARQLRNLGFTDAHDFTHLPRGHNYRLANSLAQKVLYSIEMAHSNIARRREVEACYEALCPAEWKMPKRDAVWVYDLRVPGMSPIEQDAVVQALQRAGIAARHSFKPVSDQPEYLHCKLMRTEGEMTQARRASREVLYLPLDPDTPSARCALAFNVLHSVLGR